MGAVIRPAGVVDLITDLFQILHKTDKFAIEITCPLGNFQGVFILVFVAPDILNGP